MDEEEKRKLRSAMKLADACEAMERSPEEYDRAAEEVLRREANPPETSPASIEELVARAKVRAGREGISVSDAFSVEAKLDHGAYWEKLAQKGIFPRSGS